ncbi:hypothetical protein GCM10023115_18590 [Pontixanthobacter gangjinensis]|uniref:Hotdog fold thioesterase n=1 Tax=Pontixanthobacter gangjinensis TaxID=1028742 RepID=A0A6I4SQH6_9SPHN|nr:PaaI family thioesterase [Pontixanthobacter gangjinensis]MXO57107.1 hotdog fold thioesterase [Pontixanthobacter gangjinensis]
MADETNTLDPLYESMGLIRIIELDPSGRAVLEYEARANQCHSGGVVQGGFVTGWIDAAMAHAAIALNGPDVVPMSLELKVSFFAPARPGIVIAEGWVQNNGRRTAFFEGQLKDSAGTILAKGTSTVMLADRGRIEAASKAAGK